MSIVTSKEIAKAIKVDKYGFIGNFFGWILMKVLKISTINRIYNKNKHKKKKTTERSAHRNTKNIGLFLHTHIYIKMESHVLIC